MSRGGMSGETFGHDVIGPIVAEFCLRLWSLTALMDRRTDAALLFCARGGLRIQLAYDRFLAASGLSSPVQDAPLMVSRVAAIRPALLRTVGESLDGLVPAAAAALNYEFSRSSVSDVALYVTGVAPAPSDRWDESFSPEGFAALLRHADGKELVEVLAEQSELFTRHLDDTLEGLRHAVLVDTGLFGTTRDLLAEAVPTTDFSSALIARSYSSKLAAREPRTFGLSVEAHDYSPASRRTALLRYWHLVEWLFEPELPSVRTFTEEAGVVRSNLEIDGWERRVEPLPGSAFAGVLAYIDALPQGPADRILRDVDRAWTAYRRAVVWPDRDHAEALEVGTRSHDFGRDATWSQEQAGRAIAMLRGARTWREGEIARTGSPLRRPLLLAIETAYGARHVTRAIERRRGRSR